MGACSGAGAAWPKLPVGVRCAVAFSASDQLPRRARQKRTNRRRLVVTLALTAVFAWRAPQVRAPQPTPSPGWRDRYTGMRFVRLGPGTFRMGTPPEEDQRE